MSKTNHYNLADLLYLMARLRDPATGCPWDLEQDFHSIVPHTIEEAYEVADAIERQDFAQLPAELGDLLFQVVYYSQMADEESRFDFADVVDTCVRKLVRRHPHVFPSGELRSQRKAGALESQQVEQQWQHIKAQERAEQQAQSTVSVLDGIALNMPALTRAIKLQKNAAKVGFDWQELSPVLAKIQEEIAELQEAIAEQDRKAIEHELGDVLFSVCNLARFVEIDPEQALRLTNQRFYQRFNYIEQRLAQQGREITECDLATLESLWDAAKQNLAKQKV
ncbi:MAG: nucleoside triphosphate pyrophosphohydrolase [Thiopseudomonas sp.]|nr:nucleoside triphosphate pyrophosphohydrolase [Thiopseudomonas sp.]MCK9464646.1 nucleoside triphosphate pyrophosphohydrolase [Thiopseudomonas sp.]